MQPLFVTFPPQGFFIRGDFLKQHHEFMPQNAVLMRELPANFSETQLMELFQGLQLEDGSPCPVPIPEKIRSEGLAWYVKVDATGHEFLIIGAGC